MSTENWHQERDRLMKLVEAAELSNPAHLTQGTNPNGQKKRDAELGVTKARLAQLNARLGDRKAE